MTGTSEVAVGETFDADGWVARWEAQQAWHVPDRDRVFGVMLDAVERLAGGAPRRVLDLGAGPGSLSRQVHDRFPDAEVVAVDADPVLLELGRRVHGDRIRWVRADLVEPGWPDTVGPAGYDAVISATALHWLPGEYLGGLTREIAGLLREGGAFFNFDTLYVDDAQTPRLAELTAGLRQEQIDARLSEPGAENFGAWWEAVSREPALADAFAEREQVGHRLDRHDHGSGSLVEWEQALHAAGFTEVAVLTQMFDRRMLSALR